MLEVVNIGEEGIIGDALRENVWNIQHVGVPQGDGSMVQPLLGTTMPWPWVQTH
jgi:hypothetical protein